MTDDQPEFTIVQSLAVSGPGFFARRDPEHFPEPYFNVHRWTEAEAEKEGKRIMVDYKEKFSNK